MTRKTPEDVLKMFEDFVHKVDEKIKKEKVDQLSEEIVKKMEKTGEEIVKTVVNTAKKSLEILLSSLEEVSNGGQATNKKKASKPTKKKTSTKKAPVKKTTTKKATASKTRKKAPVKK